MKKLFKITLFIITLFIFSIPLFISLPFNPITPEEYISEFDVKNGKFLSINNYTTYYIDYNENLEKTVLLVHGFGGSSTNWNPVMQNIADAGYRVVAVDLKGFGLSEKNVFEKYSHMDQVEFLNSFIQKLNLKNITLVGHSMGGNIVTMYFQEYPDDINGIVLVSASLVYEKDIDLIRASALEFLNNSFLRNYASFVLNIFFNEKRISQLFQSATFNSLDIPQPIFINPTIFENWADVLIGMVSSQRNNFLKNPVSEIDIPVLIIWGREDTWVTLSNGDSLHSEISKSEYHILENVGHLPMIEDPKGFVNFLSDFLMY